MEENTLRELRLFLRQIVWKLMADRKFKEFLKPVDLEEVFIVLDKTGAFCFRFFSILIYNSIIFNGYISLIKVYNVLFCKYHSNLLCFHCTILFNGTILRQHKTRQCKG